MGFNDKENDPPPVNGQRLNNTEVWMTPDGTFPLPVPDPNHGMGPGRPDLEQGSLASASTLESKEKEEMAARIREKRRVRCYRKIMKNAHMSKRHLPFMYDFYASEKMKMGYVSSKIYDGIFDAREFDRYGNVMCRKLSEREQMVANLQSTISQAHADQQEEDEEETQRSEVVAKLRTPKWKIGYKEDTYGPTGCVPPMRYRLKSEG